MMRRTIFLLLFLLGVALPVYAGEGTGHPEPAAPTSAVYLPYVSCEGPAVFGQPSCGNTVVITSTVVFTNTVVIVATTEPTGTPTATETETATLTETPDPNLACLLIACTPTPTETTTLVPTEPPATATATETVC